ncbi:16S rRNA (guanine(966)-N(2))-methyltransferase RsmD [Geomonas sp. RF6]|nr:16S rRNA (guanine(966)-N(2))-methyltransferase RsmD [Geomonas sp. RF6]
MRIIAGVARGQKLNAPKGMRVRPTADRVKEALFSIIASRLGSFEGLRVLDIFAGTGNLGIEALSRGAGYALFIDSHRDSVTVLKQNLQQVKLAEKAKVLAQDAVAALRAASVTEAPFDLVLLDPPYRQGHAERVLEVLGASPLVSEETLVVAEFAKGETIPVSFGRLQEIDRRNYGDTVLSFLVLGTEETEPEPSEVE